MFKKFLNSLESEFADDFLETLLDVMAVALRFPHISENIKGFDARYVFRAEDGSLAATAIFEGGRMRSEHEAILEPKPNIAITFKNSKALMGLLLAGHPDVLQSMLRQEVRLEGNLNYLYKFAYMAQHVKLLATHWV